MLVVLDTLHPDERLAFVLHDMFAVPYAEIAQVIGSSPDVAKMMASRARRKVQGAPRSTAGRQEQRQVVDAFIAAARDGDVDGLLEVLDPDVTWTTHRPRGEVVRLGRTEVIAATERGRARLRRRPPGARQREPGVLTWSTAGKPLSLMSCTVVGGRIVDVVALVDPVRLSGMDLPPAPVEP